MCVSSFVSLQEAENTLRMMQHKLKEEERDLMKSSCEANIHMLQANKNKHFFDNGTFLNIQYFSCSER